MTPAPTFRLCALAVALSIAYLILSRVGSIGS